MLLCLGDTLSNLRELNRDYEKIGNEVWERFNMRDKESQAWFYRELVSILEKTFAYEYYEEMEECAVLLGQLFSRQQQGKR